MIDFPLNPVHGNTYTYLGIIYTYKKLVGDPGFWQVTTVGTYGPALASEINTGTDAVKYVSPLELANSGYINAGDAASHVEVNSGVDWYKYITPGALAASQYAKESLVEAKMDYIPLYPPVRLLDWNGSPGAQDTIHYFQANILTYPDIRFCNLVVQKLDGTGVDAYSIYSTDNVRSDVRLIHGEDYIDTPPMMVECSASGNMIIQWGQFDTTNVDIWMLGYWRQAR